MGSKNKEIFGLQEKYFQSGITRDIKFRIQQLKKLKAMVKENEAAIIDSIYQDFGKAEFEQYLTEIGLFYEEIGLFIRKLRRWMKPEKHKLPITFFPCTGKMVRDPYGVVLLISPYNYPFSLIFSPLIGAIAGGNCTMIKPSEYTVHFYKLLHKLIGRYFDEGFLYVCDPMRGKEAVNELLEFPYNYIFFTGSTHVGKIVMEKAAKNLVPVTLELGGKSPCIVTENANLNMTAKRIVWGKMVNAGQTCVAPDYIWVHKSVKDALLKELKSQIELQYGKTTQENPEYCRIINGTTVKRLKEYLKDGTVYYGGEYDIEKQYFGPTILTDVDENSKVMQEEIFGPVLPVMEFWNLSDVEEYMSRKPSPLALYVFSEDKKEVHHLLKRIPSGGAVVNDVLIHVGVTKFPFGGVGQSGMGQYHGRNSLETFTHKRTILDRKTWVEFPVRFAPYSKHKLLIFRKLLK